MEVVADFDGEDQYFHAIKQNDVLLAGTCLFSKNRL